MIEGKDVNLRTILESDLNDIYQLETSYADAGEFMPISLLSEVDFVSAFRTDGFWRDTCGKLIIEDKQGTILGVIGCFKGVHYIDGREIYYRIFSGHRRKGYATEALAIFINFYFEFTHFYRLQGVTISGNEVSSKILEGNGFKYEGCLREARWFKGQIVNLNLYSLLRKEWSKE